MSFNPVEWFGYFASMVILISLTMTSIVKLRWINLVGCVLFALFAYCIDSIPTIFMNLGIAGINLYFLYQIYYAKEEYKILAADTSSEYYQHFISVYKSAIEQQASIESLSHQSAFYILRNNIIAGLLIGNNKGDGVLNIKLDFVIPQYRDFKLGKYYLSDHPDFFKKKGISLLRAQTRDKDHQCYLEKVGFIRESPDSTFYAKSI